MTKGHFTEFVGDAVIPKRARPFIANYFRQADRDVPYTLIGVIVYFGFLLGMVAAIGMLFLPIFDNFNIFIDIVFVIIFTPIFGSLIGALIAFVYKIYIDAIIYRRIKKMEESFPEFLTELSLNLKAGLVMEKAIENSIEEEFGALADELKHIVKQIHLGMNADEALDDFMDLYDSNLMEESFSLILVSIKKGARTPPLIDRLVDTVEEQRYLRKKVIASVSSYKIFLAIVTLMITPAMFALAFHLIGIVRDIFNQILSVSEAVTLPIPINEVAINDTHFIYFSFMGLALISICSSIINAIITKGSIKGSYKRIVFFSLVAMGAYQFFIWLFGLFFSWFKIG